MVFNCTEVVYPTEAIYHRPTFAQTGITLKELHRLRARHFVTAHDNFIIDTEEYSNRNRVKLAALLKLKIEVFPGWNPDDRQIELLNEQRRNLSYLNRCAICGVYTGTYCDVPSLPTTSCPSPSSPPRPTPRVSEVHPRKFQKRTRKN